MLFYKFQRSKRADVGCEFKSKFKGDPTVNEFEIVILLKHVFGQTQNHTVPTQINQIPHNLTSTPNNCTRIIHTTLQLIQINHVFK